MWFAAILSYVQWLGSNKISFETALCISKNSKKLSLEDRNSGIISTSDFETTMSGIPFFPYKLFFLYVEPISALAGAYYAGFRPAEYLEDLVISQSIISSTQTLTTPMTMSLAQLANLYLLFALNEHLVLSSSSSKTVWRRLLFCLLLADFGHLATMIPLGPDTFWKVWEWNAILWGSVGFVYLGASLRISFLAGLGMSGGTGRQQTHGGKIQKEQ
jgi:hypothetical protein